MPSSPLKLPPVPITLKPIAHYLKTASENENRDPVTTYWCRLSALQNGLSLDKSSKEALALLMPLMDWLEKEKKVLSTEEAVTNEVVASAHIENYAMKLFLWADKEDREARFNKNVVKAFYNAGILFDVLTMFGELTPENAHSRKYAKWKAAYIHNCLKNGQKPIAGPVPNDDKTQMPDAVAAKPETESPRPSAGWQVPTIGTPPAEVEGRHPVAGTTKVPETLVPAQPTFPTEAISASSSTDGGVGLTSEVILKAKKYCKFASSALDYEDSTAAIDNLCKALNLLKSGKDS